MRCSRCKIEKAPNCFYNTKNGKDRTCAYCRRETKKRYNTGIKSESLDLQILHDLKTFQGTVKMGIEEHVQLAIIRFKNK